MSIQWDDAWNTKITVIDQQHRKLLSIVNDLGEAMRVGKSKEVIQDVITVLLDYTRNHFGAEERLMARANYPDFDAHKKLHEEFIGKIDEYNNKVKAGSSIVSIDMFGYLSTWIIKHIKGTDSQYVPYLGAK